MTDDYEAEMHAVQLMIKSSFWHEPNPVVLLDFPAWRPVDFMLHICLILMYSRVEEFRPLMHQALDQEVTYTVEHLPSGTLGICRKSKKQVVVSKDILHTENRQVLSGVLAHEIVHAIRPATTDHLSCFEEELLCFKWQALVFEAIPGEYSMLDQTYLYRDTAIYADHLDLVEEWKYNRLQQRVLLSKTYQKNCLGREIVG